VVQLELQSLALSDGSGVLRVPVQATDAVVSGEAVASSFVLDFASVDDASSARAYSAVVLAAAHSPSTCVSAPSQVAIQVAGHGTFVGPASGGVVDMTIGEVLEVEFVVSIIEGTTELELVAVKPSLGVSGADGIDLTSTMLVFGSSVSTSSAALVGPTDGGDSTALSRATFTAVNARDGDSGNDFVTLRGLLTLRDEGFNVAGLQIPLEATAVFAAAAGAAGGEISAMVTVRVDGWVGG
jgi:hypothetical protein